MFVSRGVVMTRHVLDLALFSAGFLRVFAGDLFDRACAKAGVYTRAQVKAILEDAVAQERDLADKRVANEFLLRRTLETVFETLRQDAETTLSRVDLLRRLGLL
jgi:hypothetical protein